jgi:hypothetical protein
MFRWIAMGALLCGFAAVAASCNNSTTTAPTGNTTTETFTGTLTPNGANTQTFLVATAGTINATIESIGPDATQTMGFSLGTFNALTNVCTVVMDNPSAVVGFLLNGVAATNGTYCIRVYDNGSVAAAAASGLISSATPWTYAVAVTHP